MSKPTPDELMQIIYRNIREYERQLSKRLDLVIAHEEQIKLATETLQRATNNEE